jgi:hypothetical protein
MPTRSGIERIADHAGGMLALVVRSNFKVDGVEFFTGPENSLQLGLMSRTSATPARPHVHLPVERQVHDTQEVLLIRSGTCLVSIYDSQGEPVSEVRLYSGDVILLVSGGHGIDFEQDCELLEIKQGPYVAAIDKLPLEQVRVQR